MAAMTTRDLRRLDDAALRTLAGTWSLATVRDLLTGGTVPRAEAARRELARRGDATARWDLERTLEQVWCAR